MRPAQLAGAPALGLVLTPITLRTLVPCPARSHMLVRQPEQRLTLPQIIQHPWFTKELPAGLLDINSRVTGNLAKQSEEEVVATVREAQGSVRVIDADNVDELADDILAEEEVDDILEELSLASGDLHMQG